MRTRPLLIAMFSVIVMLSMAVAPQGARAEVDIYTTEGTHQVNGREWRTTCEPYSAVERCRTEIVATVVHWRNNEFVTVTDWTFNNLTYTPGPRSIWAKNPLGAYGKVGGTARWEGTDRQWRTECDTAITGQGGCRSYTTARVVEPYRTSSGATSHRMVTKWVFNSMVRFSPTPAPVRPPVKPLDPTAGVVDPNLRDCLKHVIDSVGGISNVTGLSCDGSYISTLKGFPVLPNLTSLSLNHNHLTTLAELPVLPELTSLTAWNNQISTFSGLEKHPKLADINLYQNKLTTLATFPTLPALSDLGLLGNPISGPVDLSHLSSGTSPLTVNLVGTAVTRVTGAGANLGSLELTGSPVTDISGLAGATNLTWLSMAGSKVTDAGPLTQLARLTHVDMTDNQLTDVTAFSGLPALTRLFLAGNNTPAPVLDDLPELTQLDLRRSHVVDASGLTNLPKLVQLRLEDNEIVDTSTMAPLPALETLMLGTNRLSGNIALSGFPQLRLLSLKGNQITSLSGMQDLPKLTRLDASQNRLTDAAGLSGFPALIFVNMGENQVSDVSGFTSLSGLTELESIILRDNQITSVAGLEGLAQLNNLALRGNEIVDLELLQPLVDAGLQVDIWPA
ncbi:hypothetical protein GCM10028820_13510 [Tessaracoccus terricola]